MKLENRLEQLEKAQTSLKRSVRNFQVLPWPLVLKPLSQEVLIAELCVRLCFNRPDACNDSL